MDKPSKYLVGKKIWLQSFYQGKGCGQKLQPIYIEPYTITKVLPYQTYEMERKGKKSIQHEGRIKACHNLPGKI